MLTLKEQKALDRLIARFIPKARKIYRKKGVEMTRESLEKVIRGSVVGKHPEALDYFLKHITL